jgi:hypothetical protein
MESFLLFAVEESAAAAFLRRARDAHGGGRLNLSTFDKNPTAMLFRPAAKMKGSLHYMFFPAPAAQRFHRHPGERYLLLLGDVDMHARYSLVGPNENPHLENTEIIIPRFHFAALRFPAEMWHQFETRNDGGTGVFAVSIHGDDGQDAPGSVGEGLMEELTTFWGDEQR